MSNDDTLRRIPDPTAEPTAAEPTTAASADTDADATRLMGADVTDVVMLSQNSEDSNEDASVTAVRHYQNFAPAGAGRVQRADDAAPDEADGYVPGEGKSRSHGRAVIAVVVVGLIAIVAALIVTYGMELWGGKTVPRVMGMREQAAVKRVEERGLIAQVVAVPVDDGVGTVVGVSPEPGTRVDADSAVTLTVGISRTIPEVMGMSLDEARAALRDAGAEDFKIVFAPSDAAEGSVVAVEPAAGSTFTSRDTITLTVAESYTVPDLVGKTEAEATHALESAGFVAEVDYVVSDEKSGTVVATDPAAGTKVESGSVVTISVSQTYPSDYRRLAEYFEHSSKNDDAFLQKEGFAFKASDSDLAVANGIYDGGGKGKVQFFSGAVAPGYVGDGKENSLAAGKPIEAVRWWVGASETPGVSRDGVIALATACGFSGEAEAVTSESAQRPADVVAAADDPRTWIAARGQDGDMTWLIIIWSDGSAAGAGASSGATNGATVDYFRTDSLSDVSSYAAGCGGNVTTALALLNLYTG